MIFLCCVYQVISSYVTLLAIQPARYAMALFSFIQRRCLFQANMHGFRATGTKTASARHMKQIGCLPRYSDKGPILMIWIGKRCQKSFRIRMLWPVKIDSTDPSSTTVPAYMTYTRWHIWAMTPRLCDMRTMAMLRRSCKCLSICNTWASVVTSRAVVGSSAKGAVANRPAPSQ